MSLAGNKDKIDLRCVKTDKALNIAMYSLLEKRSFRKITVNDICTAAFISRAAFYTHYTDKYDFLASWLTRILPQKVTCDMDYLYIEKIINKFVLENKAIIKNVVNDADEGTLDIMFRIVLSFLNLTGESDKPGSDPEQIIFHNIYVGGIINYIFWQVKNNFPAKVLPMNRHLYNAIKKCRGIEPE